MKDGEYWKQRFKQMEEAQNDTSVRKAQEIQEQFDRSLAAIDGKINAWYQRLANNNGVSMQEARKMLDKGELKEFQWNAEDYIKYAEENEISGAWTKQLENASARVHISRLEALKIETQHEMEKLYGNCVDAVDEHIRNVYTSDFYHTAYEIQKGIGVGSNIQKLNPDAVEKIICKPWAVDEKNFSDRLWESKTKLINNVHNSLSRMCITGEPPDRAIKEIAKEMDVSKAQAGRLVMTESAAFANKARQDCMKELDVEEFEVVETLDSHTCGTCGDMDGKHYPMRDFEIGVTAPPFHPNCRGCTCPYFNDEFTQDEERAARGTNGKTYYVPADMTYKQWQNSFVDGGSKNDLIPIVSDEQLEHIMDGAPRSSEMTIDSISDEATESLLNAYDDRRKHFNLNMTSADDLRAMGNMNPVTVNYDGVSLETAHAFDATIQKLSDEYYTGLTKIEVGDKKEFFGANVFATTRHNNTVGQKTLILNPHKTNDYNKMTERIKELSDKGYAVKIADGLEGEYIATHEFAHSLIDLSGNYKNYVGMDVKQMKGIKKELDSLFGEYKTEVNVLESVYKEKELAFLNSSLSANVDIDELARIQKEAAEAKQALDKVKISKYSLENADEFMAEAFTDVKIGSNPSEYSKKVEAVIDGYFKKEVVEGSVKNGTIVSGAISGARNPFSDKAKEHAQKYYGLVRSMKTDVAKISRATGMSEDEVQSVKNFIFLEKHDLGGKELEYFQPDYMMAESWQRLIEGKPEQHDITLLKHEVLEKKLMEKGLSQEKAHIQASKKYNYSKEAGEYYAKIEKYKD